jgi:hypothetical protein
MKYSIAVYIISIQTSNSFSHYLKTVIYFIQSTVGAILYSGKLHYLKELLTERMTSTLNIMFIQLSFENTWIMDAVSGLLSSMNYQWCNT